MRQEHSAAGTRRVLVHGAGIGGLTAAVALARLGIEVDVVELRAADSAPGVGLIQPSNALGALATLGLRDACLAAGFSFEELHIRSPDGRLTTAIPPPVSGYGPPSHNAISRARLSAVLTGAALRSGARIHYGATITELVEDPATVTVTASALEPDADDSPVLQGCYDLVLGFDGIRSPLRTHLYGSSYEPELTGQAVWRASVPRPAEVDRVIMSSAGDRKAVLTPIDASTMYIALVVPAPGNPWMDRQRLPQLFHEQLVEAGFGGTVGAVADTVKSSRTVAYTPLEQVTVAEPWFRGRIAIAGDAAHATVPQLAQGAAMAVEDAVVLGESLREHPVLGAALTAWYERRRPRAAFVQDFSRALLRQESGLELSSAEAVLMGIGIPGAQARLAEPY
ncbi:FAD-dependent monooxygenase [Streptomyces sp. H27-D2]|uniref:FAD-dependent monooxygenase n=1 Tax=Streptomyces sp. H27-D2 TaxID=3046304 RepID=UPI002DBA4D7B|nr:FAD-dependent monooxygenase [Streptomyces sp. H27-D2]MEC4017889.1 FAD-dependent monooxygenase [Streptomyces sp. H27-D2]